MFETVLDQLKLKVMKLKEDISMVEKLRMDMFICLQQLEYIKDNILCHGTISEAGNYISHILISFIIQVDIHHHYLLVSLLLI